MWKTSISEPIQRLNLCLWIWHWRFNWVHSWLARKLQDTVCWKRHLHLLNQDQNTRRYSSSLSMKKLFPKASSSSASVQTHEFTPFINKPKLCRHCQQYGHTTSRCNKELTCGNCSVHHASQMRDITICGRCNRADHTSRDCNNDTCECHHCYEDHLTKSNKCSTNTKKISVSSK